jgi:cobalt-zinc-cadmium efflux system membrane fusion protein
MRCLFLGPVTGRPSTPFGAFNLAAVIAVLAACWFGSGIAVAHEGHDDMQLAAASKSPGLPRLVTRSETYELVAVLQGERLTIYLDRFEDNAPVADANITVTVNEEQVIAQPSGEATYNISSKRFGGRGLVELVFDIKAKDGEDLLIGKFTLAGSAQNGPSPDALPWYGRAWSYARHGAEDHLTLVTIVLLAGLALGHVLHRHRFRELLIVFLAVTSLAVGAMDRVASAHEGEHADESKPAALTGDTARRLPEGPIFVPKPMQRILDIRTAIARSEAVPKTAVFLGRIIANPNRSGLVQSINGGRASAPEQGLPRLGQAISKGDLLALIEPPMASADRTTISERAGELEQMIAVAEAKIKRLRPMAERQVIPQSLVIETEAELEGLYRRRDVVRETRFAPESLRAPIDGVLAMSRVVSGQVVQAQDVLFQIVDPNSLWVEAYDYGDSDPATLKHATAVGPANVALELDFVGWSRTLQQQATVLQFAIAAPPASIRVGQPVTVTAQRQETARGIIIGRDAVVRGGNGESIVWRHVEAELFEPRPVRTEPFDATRLLIAAGIGEGERIVVRGAELINQIR